MSPRTYDRLRIVLSLIGLGIAAYLTLQHYDSDVPLVCSGGSLVDCATVLNSPSAVFLGVPVAAWGLVWFVVAAALALIFVRYPPTAKPHGLRLAALGWVIAGVASVLWLVYQELGVVGKLCAWCTAVHAIVLTLLIVEVEQAEQANFHPSM